MSSEASKIIDLYERHATNFDKDRGRCLFEKPWLERFLSLIPPRGSILDIGCGSGEPIARFFIEQSSHLDTVGDLDEGNALIHPVVFTVEGHCPYRPLLA